MSDVKFLEKIKRVKGAYLYKDLESPQMYKVTTNALMPGVISTADGELEKPSPWKTFGWSWVVTLPLLIAAKWVPYAVCRFIAGGLAAIWLPLMLWILLQNISFSKHWSDCSIEEVS